jgi:hypothetical protein
LTRHARKERLIHELGGKCFRCGVEDLHWAAYHFHHKVPKDKIYGISGSLTCRENVFESDIVPEVREKCVLLCANCHAVIHSDREEMTDLVFKIQAKDAKTGRLREALAERGLLIDSAEN